MWTVRVFDRDGKQLAEYVGTVPNAMYYAYGALMMPGAWEYRVWDESDPEPFTVANWESDPS